jgi:tetratricopeptide (TPR) repeat protein
MFSFATLRYGICDEITRRMTNHLTTTCFVQSAISNYRKAVMLAPENHAVKTRLAGVLDCQGHVKLEEEDFAGSIPYFSEAIEMDHYQALFFLHRALANIRMHNWSAAFTDADKAAHVDSNNCDAFILRGKLNWKLGKKKAGNEDFKRAHKIDRFHPEVKVFEQMMWGQAEKAYQDASAYLLQRNYDQAIELLSSALELNPGDVKVLVLRASALRQKGSYEAALEDLAEASEIYCYNQNQQLPDHGLVEGGGGGGGGGSGNNEPTNGAYEHPEITRQRNLTHNDMAVHLCENKQYLMAITLFNKVIAAEMQSARVYDGTVVDARFYVNRGDCYRSLGKLVPALADYHSAFEIVPKDWDVNTRLSLVRHAFGVKLFNEGRFQEAEIEFTTAISHNPKVSLYYTHRGNAMFHQLKYDLAHEDYAMALEIDPDNDDLRYRIAQFQPNIKTKPMPKFKRINPNEDVGMGEQCNGGTNEPPSAQLARVLGVSGGNTGAGKMGGGLSLPSIGIGSGATAQAHAQAKYSEDSEEQRQGRQEGERRARPMLSADYAETELASRRFYKSDGKVKTLFIERADLTQKMVLKSNKPKKQDKGW